MAYESDNRSAFIRAISDAHRNTWRVSRAQPPVSLTLDAGEIPPADSYQHFASAVEYVRKKHSLDLTVQGGGYGCFSLVVGVEGNQASSKAAAQVIADEQFQQEIGEAGFDVARVASADGEVIFSAFYDYDLAVVTNRAPLQNPSARLPFGNERHEKMSYLLLDVSLPRATAGRVGMLKALWRKVRRAPSLHHNSTASVEIRKTTLLTQPAFEKLLKERAKQGALLHVHGFAVSFPSAVTASTLFYHNAELARLGFLPVLFSWPSRGSPAAYDPDTYQAEESEIDLVKTIGLIKQNSKALSISAHSHGNKILVRALTGAMAPELLSDDSIEHTLLLAPDVGKGFLEQQLEHLTRWTKNASLYFSSRDLALAASNLKFWRQTAGRNPVSGGTKLNIIDASAATEGLLNHSYYGVVREVLSDIYYALSGLPPHKRKGLIKASNESNVWTLTPTGKPID